jgi:lipopolysaccharide export system permease protein
LRRPSLLPGAALLEKDECHFCILIVRLSLLSVRCRGALELGGGARGRGVSGLAVSIAPALVQRGGARGILATRPPTNPILANLRELSNGWRRSCSAPLPAAAVQDASGFWINQVNSDGNAHHQCRPQRTAGGSG